ncbi:ammonium transporter [Enterococcus devriesei]|uniref:ammonium transporter n=1 Tax=Enterococcus devriesei TaxID=319970 RepID=UPI0028AE4F6B|nr:ammonium transporter [Enterococcus devriesei]
MNNLSINMGDTAFMILCTAMVCLMTPGLAFFYGGLARKNNILTIMGQSFLSVGITTIMWIFGGFGLSFGSDIGGVIGNPTDYFLMNNVTSLPNLFHGSTIPFMMFFLYQLMFVIITVPLMTGAFAGRMNLKGYILLIILWNLLVYFPVCHWIWGGGLLDQLGFRDFAGGAVIHTTAGFGSLACILRLGQRKISIDQRSRHSNLMAAAIGTGLLWFGWFGFNSGGALRADSQAVNAFGSTFVALAFAMITWLIVAKVRGNNFDFVDVLTGSVAGLATITPCAGYVKPESAILIGMIAGIICHAAVDFRKKKQWDDALDVWGVHGMGGFTGTILVGIFATNSHLLGELNSWYFLGIQIIGVILVAAYAYLITTVILNILMRYTTITTTKEEQEKGLDFTFFDNKNK